ncbi:MAG: hypothetical protein IKM08_06805, partial [Clostridia bacterium]|nr:hypothetical protein [Clostridia bacterium]
DDDDDAEYFGFRKSASKASARYPFSKNDLLATITALLGGYAAEEIILHKIHDTIAPSMRIVNRILLRMAECGMFGFSLMYIDLRWRELPYSAAYTERMDRTFEQTLQKCYEQARAIVCENERLIKKLAPALSKRGVIEKSECEELIFEFGGIA